FLRRGHLHWQRPEFHGQGHRGATWRAHAFIHGVHPEIYPAVPAAGFNNHLVTVFPGLKSDDIFETISRVESSGSTDPAFRKTPSANALQHFIPVFFRAVVAVLFLAAAAARRL